MAGDSRNALLRLVCTYLHKYPSLYERSCPTTVELLKAMTAVVKDDPEFVLKLAHYVKHNLRLRLLANFLLAYTCVNNNVKVEESVFCACITLPIDFIEIIEFVQVLKNPRMSNEKMSASAGEYVPGQGMVYPEGSETAFEYLEVLELSHTYKYRSHPTSDAKIEGGLFVTKRNRLLFRESFRNFTPHDFAVQQSQDAETVKKGHLKSLSNSYFYVVTMKKVIQLCKLVHEDQHLMYALLGRRYPQIEEEHKKLGFPGQFNPADARSRVNLDPIQPQHINKVNIRVPAAEWNDLIAADKVCHTTLVKNITNLLYAGVPTEVHAKVCDLITQSDAVLQSKNSPLFYLDAIKYTQIKEAELQKTKDDINYIPKYFLTLKRNQKNKKVKKVIKNLQRPELVPTSDVIYSYRTALKQAVQTAMASNLSPIAGKTLVLLDASSSMNELFDHKKSPLKTLFDLSAFIGVMISQCCENSELQLFSGSGSILQVAVDLPQDYNAQILNTIRAERRKLGNDVGSPCDILSQKKESNTAYDIIIVLGSASLESGASSLKAAMTEYRQSVQQNALLVNVNVSSHEKKTQWDGSQNLIVSGFNPCLLEMISVYQSMTLEAIQAGTNK